MKLRAGVAMTSWATQRGREGDCRYRKGDDEAEMGEEGWREELQE